jgi:hypothetical protein
MMALSVLVTPIFGARIQIIAIFIGCAFRFAHAQTLFKHRIEHAFVFKGKRISVIAFHAFVTFVVTLSAVTNIFGALIIVIAIFICFTLYENAFAYAFTGLIKRTFSENTYCCVVQNTFVAHRTVMMALSVIIAIIFGTIIVIRAIFIRNAFWFAFAITLVARNIEITFIIDRKRIFVITFFSGKTFIVALTGITYIFCALIVIITIFIGFAFHGNTFAYTLSI